MGSFDKHFNTADLILKYLQSNLTEAERTELDMWIAQSASNEALFNKLTKENSINSELEIYQQTENEEAWRAIQERTGQAIEKKKTINVFLKYAAALVLLAMTAAILYYFIGSNQNRIEPQQEVADFSPGGNRAVLVLANGREVLLDTLPEGKLIRQAGMYITKTFDGQLEYHTSPTDGSGANSTSEPVYNSIKTPRGGQFRVILPDGTKVWLNSASALKYPVRFAPGKRVVELSGEAYFEVKTLPGSTPFEVTSGMQTVQVLGTHFNINSYYDEPRITTSLLEGAVKIRSQGQTVLLQPGQQAQLSVEEKSDFKVVKHADVEEAVAWKNGLFQFKDTDLKTIMRQVARWYDVEIKYLDTVPNINFRGRIPRDVPASQVFEVLKASGINLKVEGRTVLIRQ